MHKLFKKLANEMMNAGRSLKDSLDKEYRNEEDERRGLRYMHGIRKDEYKIIRFIFSAEMFAKAIAVILSEPIYRKYF